MSTDRTKSPIRGALAASAATFALALAVYVLTLQTTVPGPDSGELIAVARTLGIAHPPGYPLYTLIAHGFGTVFAWGSWALRLDLLSAILQALAAAAACGAVCRLTAQPWAGLAAGLAFALSRAVWRGALVAEVFPLNDLMAALLWLGFAGVLADAGLLPGAAARPDASGDPAREPRPWPAALMLLVSAAIPAHHHSLVLLAAPLDLVALVVLLLPDAARGRWLPGARRPYRIGRARIAAGAGLVLLGLTPLAYLPLAAARDPLLNWGDPDTAQRFFAHLLRSEYGTLSLAAVGPTVAADVHHGLLYLRALPSQFAWAGALLSLVGLLAWALDARGGGRPHRAGASRDERGRRAAGEQAAHDPRGAARVVLVAVVLVAWAQWLFLGRVHFSSLNPYYRGVVERFYMLPHLTVAVLAGRGAAAILSATAAGARRNAALALVLVTMGAPLALHYRTLDQRGNSFVEDLGRNVLASLPANAVLFSAGDVFYSTLTYLTVVEGERPDVVFVDELLLTRSWYTRSLRLRHPGLLPPFTARAEPDSDHYGTDSSSANVRWIDWLEGRRPVAFTRVIERSYEARYELLGQGLVLVPHRIGNSPGVAERARAAARLLASFRLDSYFRSQDPWSVEAESRIRVSRFVAGACLLLSEPEGRALTRAEYPGLETLARFLDRADRERPAPDPELLRAAALLHAFHPEFRDLARARDELERYLATGPQGPEADGARYLLGRIDR